MTFDPDQALNAPSEENVALDKALAKLQSCDLTEWDDDFVSDLIKRMEKRGTAFSLTGNQQEHIERMKKRYGI